LLKSSEKIIETIQVEILYNQMFEIPEFFPKKLPRQLFFKQFLLEIMEKLAFLKLKHDFTSDLNANSFEISVSLCGSLEPS